MLTQYTRVYTDALGDVVACHTRDAPFPDGYDPIENDDPTTPYDVEVETDFVDLDYKREQRMLDADKLLAALEVVGGLVKVRADADPLVKVKVKSISNVKNIHAAAIRAEMQEDITHIVEVGGQTMTDFIEELNALGVYRGTITTLDDINLPDIRRLLKSLKRGRP